MEDTTVLTGEVITMERDRLKMNPLPQDQTPMLTLSRTVGVSFTVSTSSDLMDDKIIKRFPFKEKSIKSELFWLISGNHIT